MFAVDETGEPLQDNVKEWIQSSKSCIVRFGHGWASKKTVDWVFRVQGALQLDRTFNPFSLPRSPQGQDSDALPNGGPAEVYR